MSTCPPSADPVGAARAAHAATAGPAAQPIWIQLLSIADVERMAAAAPADGPLAGTAFGVKDSIDIQGYPTTVGCPDLETGPGAAHTAVAVQRLIDAGAVPIGKTNLDQFATGLVGTRSPYGACHSVAGPAHVSGGSSSGSAVAVAAGLVAFAVATDTAGSGRVPAGFNGIVGVKPTRGLISTRGVFPACRSIDCVTTLSRTVSQARTALDAMRFADLLDPLSRPLPGLPPPGVADRMRVLAVPRDRLDLDPEHAWAWERALAHAAGIARLVPVDIEPFLAAGRLLYQGPWVAERWSAFGHLLAGPGVDPTVRTIVSAGRDVTGSDVFAGLDRLAALRRFTAPVWTEVDALLLPVTPGHPTLAAVAADPIGVNGRLGTYTTFGNLLDLCAIAVPAGRRDDNLPFGVQLIAPAFADAPLLDLAARWCAEPELLAPLPPGWTLLAVCGAHLSGLPLNPHLLRQGGRLRHRARTGPGYRLFRLPGDGIARAGLVHTGDGPDDGIAVEVWALPHQGVGALLDSVPPPLGFGPITLDDNTVVSGFLAGAGAGGSSEDISGYGGWRAYLASRD